MGMGESLHRGFVAADNYKRDNRLCWTLDLADTLDTIWYICCSKCLKIAPVTHDTEPTVTGWNTLSLEGFGHPTEWPVNRSCWCMVPRHHQVRTLTPFSCEVFTISIEGDGSSRNVYNHQQCSQGEWHWHSVQDQLSPATIAPPLYVFLTTNPTPPS